MKKRIAQLATSLWVIAAFGAILRLLFFVDYLRQNSRHALGILPFLFECGNIAVSLAQGHGFSSPFRVATGPTAWMTPVYPLFLAGIFRVFGVYAFRSFVVSALSNIAFVTLALVPLYYAGMIVGGRNLGAGAAWLWAIFPNAILMTFETMWEACLSALLAAAILWATLRLERSSQKRGWAAYGLLWGVALMTNPVLFSLLPLLLGWLAYRRWRAARPPKWRTAFGQPALALAVTILCCVPWTVRNYETFHRFVPFSSVLGLQLWLGNNSQAKPIWRARLHPINNTAERADYVKMGEIPYMSWKFRLATEYMRNHPGRTAYLAWRRFLAIWSGGRAYPLRDFVRNHSLWFRFVLLFNLLAGIAAAAGIVVLFKRRSAYAFPLAVFPVVFPWAYYLTLALPRYRLPIDPVVMLLAAVAAGALFRPQTPQRTPAGAKKSPKTRKAFS